jgi:single-strand DNA-binding protein
MSAIVNLVGRLGKDPESSETGRGTAITRLSVATNTRKKADGEWQDITTWWRVTLFGQPATYAADYLHKGDLVEVAGEASQDSFTGRDGETRHTLEVKGFTVSRLSQRSDEGQSESRPESRPRRTAPPASDYQAAPGSPAAPSAAPAYDDDEPPF